MFTLKKNIRNTNNKVGVEGLSMMFMFILYLVHEIIFFLVCNNFVGEIMAVNVYGYLLQTITFISETCLLGMGNRIYSPSVCGRKLNLIECLLLEIKFAHLSLQCTHQPCGLPNFILLLHSTEGPWLHLIKEH